MKILHSADWQLGKPFGRFEPDLRAALTEARFDAIDTLGRLATEQGAKHVIVAGDVFDTEGPDDRTIVQAVSRMSQFDCRWWLLPGTRIAFADLLLEQGRPVSLILDDPLVYSDDGRLDTMVEILSDVATRMQVILLTCRDRAFRHVQSNRLMWR